MKNNSLIMQAESLAELQDVIGKQMTYYNQDRRHSALSYRTPQQVVQAVHLRNIASEASNGADPTAGAWASSGTIPDIATRIGSQHPLKSFLVGF